MNEVEKKVYDLNIQIAEMNAVRSENAAKIYSLIVVPEEMKKQFAIEASRYLKGARDRLIVEISKLKEINLTWPY